jgi:putative membrane protein
MGAVIRMILLFGLALMFIRLLVLGEIRLFVAPRLAPFVWISSLLLILLGLVQMRNINKPALHPTGWIGYGLLFLPLGAFLLTPPSALDASIAAKKGIQYVTPEAMQSQQRVLTKEETEARKKGSPPPAVDKNQPDAGEAMTEKTAKSAPSDPNPYYNKILQELRAAPVITMNSQNYLDRLTTIQLHEEHLKGKQIRTVGFVYRTDNMPKDLFLVGRYAMTCCAADASVTGFFAKVPQPDQWKEGTWIEVEGTLGFTEVENSRVPMVKSSAVKKVKPLKDPYIYSNY